MRRVARSLIGLAAATTLVAAANAAPASARRAPNPGVDIARYILPPGNYGGLPATDKSRDQLPLYDGLTPLRGNVTDADIESHFLPENFKPIGATQEIHTGRPGAAAGVRRVRRRAHLRADPRRPGVRSGVGDRARPARVVAGRALSRACAVADVPGIDAFSLVTSGQSFEPSAATESLIDDQKQLLVATYGDKGRQVLADAQAEADGVNAYLAANNIATQPFTVNDVIAVTAFIGSIFGSGGGAEARNADLLAKLQTAFGSEKGRKAWEDVMLFDDSEAPTTTNRRFSYGPLTGGRVRGSVIVDPDSIVSLDPRQPAAATTAPAAGTGLVDAASAPPRKEASNFLVVNPIRSASRQHAGRDGAAARLLLPRDRAAGGSPRARHRRARGRGPGSRHVRVDRPYA